MFIRGVQSGVKAAGEEGDPGGTRAGEPRRRMGREGGGTGGAGRCPAEGEARLARLVGLAVFQLRALANQGRGRGGAAPRLDAGAAGAAAGPRGITVSSEAAARGACRSSVAPRRVHEHERVLRGDVATTLKRISSHGAGQFMNRRGNR